MADLKLVQTAAEEALKAQFSASDARRTGWAANRAREAFEAFTEQGMPHRRMEAWKYTDLRAMMREANTPSRPYAGALDALNVFADLDLLQFRVVNGFVAEMPSSLPVGMSVYRLRDVFGSGASPFTCHIGALIDVKTDMVAALNTAFVEGGIIIKIEDGVEVKQPIHVDLGYIGQGGEAAYARVIVLMGKNAKATVVETHVSEATGYHTNVVLEASLDDGAQLHHLKVQNETLDAMHLATSSFKLGADAVLKTASVHTGSGMYRNNVNVTFAGENSSADVGAATMLKNKQHGDTTLFVDHAVPHCTSRELFKTVVDDNARAVFQGKILVRPDAQKTDGQMMTQALHLSETAEVNAKPELEIYADDVQCAHGATMGELDEELMFYLTSRGIPEGKAKALLVQAFLGEVFELVPDVFHDSLIALTEGWLQTAHTETLKGSGA